MLGLQLWADLSSVAKKNHVNCWAKGVKKEDVGNIAHPLYTIAVYLKNGKGK